MSKLIGYAYEADCHCIGCTYERFGSIVLTDDLDLWPKDSEGNPISVIFNTDEHPQEGIYCADCLGTICEPYKQAI